MTAALILTGPPGAGKSAVLEALTTLLDVAGEEYSAFEPEQLAWGNPWLPSSQWLPQLETVMALQRGLGRRLFLVAIAVEGADELRAVAEAVGADVTIVVLLTCAPDIAAARIAAREPDRWPGKAALVAQARRLAESLPRDLDGVDARVATDDRDRFAAAEEVFSALRAGLARRRAAGA